MDILLTYFIILTTILRRYLANSQASAAQDQLPRWQSSLPPDNLITVTCPNGIPAPSLTASEQVGAGGPILLKDSNLIDNLAHFNREQIPQRNVFANGVGAHGFFRLTEDLTSFTLASVLNKVRMEVPVFCRFSMALEDKGFPETGLDLRGIACKFYTDEGNWDLLTQTALVYPIRDPMLFPSFFHSQKRNPQTGIYDMNSLWDFRSLRPETVFQTLSVLSDMGLPDGYRHMSTSGIITYRLINQGGDVTLAKFHLMSNQGPKNLTLQQSLELMAGDPSYARRDLFDNIQSGNFPSWTVSVQLMTLDEASKFPWSPVDPTKVWFSDDHPLIPIGTLVLNRNVDNFFAETEMVAFAPTNLPRGIELFPEPLSSAMAFAYKDAQRYRLGANFEQLPINRPTVPVQNYWRDGSFPMNNGGSGPNYFPNSFGGPTVGTEGPSASQKIFLATIDRFDTVNEDNFSQPRIWLEGLSPGERERMVGNVGFFLSFAAESVRERMFLQFRNVSTDLETEIRQAVADSVQQHP